ncbi:MAG: hypothetical protein KTR31_40030 [Myxococcales bacterium]|nr:hypothetical protein [Myxococcales bacterium]
MRPVYTGGYEAVVDVPDRELQPIHDASEQVRATLPTLGQRAWLDPEGSQLTSAIWAVATEQRLWLVAASDAGRWAVAVGDPAEVQLVRGWTRDTLVVGAWRMPVRKRLRESAEELVAAFAAGGGGGAPVAVERAADVDVRADVAVGAPSVPAWLAEAVPAPSRERWLYAHRTRAWQPFHGRDGSVSTGDVWVALTDRRTVLAARRSGSPVWWVGVEAVVADRVPGQLLAEARRLPGEVDTAAVAAALSGAVSPVARWSLAAEAAASAGRGEQATALLAEAQALGHDAGWATLARLLLLAGAPELAVSAALRALGQGADAEALLASWADGERLRPVPLRTLRRQLDVLDGLRAPPQTPEGVPWPVEGPLELWAMALLLAGRAVRATDLWLTAPDSERRQQAVVALTELQAAQADPEEARTLWQRSVDEAPDVARSHEGLAQVLAEELGRPVEGAAVLQGWLDRASDEQDGLGAVRVRQARWQLRAERRSAAAETLAAAVAADFLQPQVWREAAALAPEAGLDPAWWLHVHGVLAGGAARTQPGRRARRRLSTEALAALHPGGVGVVERVRQALSGERPPDRATLTRGLGALSAKTHPLEAEILERLCDALELKVPKAYVFRGEGAVGASAWATDPPVILLGAEHLAQGSRALSPEGLSFLLAVELVHLKCEHPVLSFDADLVGTSRSVYRSFGRFAGTAEGLVDVVTLIPGVDQLAKLQRVILLSRRVFATRSAVDRFGKNAVDVLGWLGLSADDQGGPSVGRQGLQGAALMFRMQADRAALLLTGDLSAAVDAILRSSSRGARLAERAATEGVAALLQDPDLPPVGLRLAALTQFAATLTDEDSPLY